MRPWILVIALIGCGDNLRDPAADYSGTRLRLVRYVFDDGTRVADTRSFYDSARSEHCGPRRWSDGATYCTPAADELSYLDASCTTAIGRVNTSATPGYFIRFSQIGALGTASRLYRAGSVASPPTEYWVQQGSVCDGPFPADANSTFFALGSELTSSAFVRIRRLESGTQDRLSVVRYSSDDGLSVPLAFHDRTLGADCDFTGQFGQTTATCAPNDATLAEYFADATCSEPMVSVAKNASPSFISKLDTGNGCTSFFGVGDELIAQPVYVLTGQTCTELLPPPGQRQYRAGTPIDVATLSRVRVQDGPRLSRIDLVAPPMHALDALLFDMTTTAECLPTATADGIRCVPQTHASIAALFADDQCQQPIKAGLVPIGSCDPVSSLAIGAPSGQTEAWLIGDPYTLPSYEISTGDRCVPYTPPPRTKLYMLPVGIRIEGFAAATIAID